MMMDMFVDTEICGFKSIPNKTKVSKYFFGSLIRELPYPEKHEIKCQMKLNNFTV